jgi:hypothetical protein
MFSQTRDLDEKIRNSSDGICRASATYTTPVLSGLRKRYKNNRWEVYSPKLGRIVNLYSNVAYHHWILIESDPEIDMFCEHPVEINIRLAGREVSTIFDMWIRRQSGLEEFQAIRAKEPRVQGDHSQSARQIDAQRKWCRIRGTDYSVITAAVIYSNPIYLSNCKFMLRHLSGLRDVDLNDCRLEVRTKLEKIGATSLFNLKEKFPQDHH